MHISESRNNASKCRRIEKLLRTNLFLFTIGPEKLSFFKTIRFFGDVEMNEISSGDYLAETYIEFGFSAANETDLIEEPQSQLTLTAETVEKHNSANTHLLSCVVHSVSGSMHYGANVCRCHYRDDTGVDHFNCSWVLNHATFQQRGERQERPGVSEAVIYNHGAMGAPLSLVTEDSSQGGRVLAEPIGPDTSQERPAERMASIAEMVVSIAEMVVIIAEMVASIAEMVSKCLEAMLPNLTRRVSEPMERIEEKMSEKQDTPQVS